MLWNTKGFEIKYFSIIRNFFIDVFKCRLLTACLQMTFDKTRLLTKLVCIEVELGWIIARQVNFTLLVKLVLVNIQLL